MAPQQDQRSGDKTNKRSAETALAAGALKKAKTAGSRDQAHDATNSQKSGSGKAQSSQHGRELSFRGKTAASQTSGKQSYVNNGPRGKPWKDARVIAAQPSDAALKDGELDVQAFLNARGFEIKALDESMRRTRVTRTSRAFQQVPFVLRRRAAAHNHKRVPKRLHRKAKREMEIDNTPTVSSRTRKPKTNRARLRAETALRLGKLAERKRRQKLIKKGKDGKLDEATVQTRIARPKIRRDVPNESIVTVRKYRKRQLEKTWLPTHLWHTKRATMTPPKEPLWRFAIPLTPNQKCYRPTHRMLREKGAMAWDMSYMSTISVFGLERSVSQALKALGLSADSFWNESGSRWRAGAVHWNGTLTRKVEKATRTIGPATIFWNPEIQDVSNESASDEQKTVRRLFIRLHPSIFLETFNELVRLAKGLTPRPHIEDLRYEIGSIEITGPDSTEALLGVLKPYPETPGKHNSHATKWTSLAGISPSGLPAGSLLALTIMDPRLRYPPRRVDIQSAANRSQQTATTWQQELAFAPSPLFDRDARFKASQLPSQRSIDRRKAKVTPGSLVEPAEADAEIPIILLASREADAPGKWTVLLPWKCVMPTWYALIHYPLSSGGNPQFGGLQEIQQGAFEQGLPWFPGDFPATDAGTAWELEQREKRRKAWTRMPKGKRVNYETLDLGAGRKGEVGEGWSCDFETLLGLKAQSADVENPDVVMEGQDEENTTANEKETKAAKSPEHPLAQSSHLSKMAFNTLLSGKLDAVAQTALVTVKIKYLGRGVPGPCARIYRLPQAKAIKISTQAEVPATNPPLAKSSGLPTNLRDQWLATLSQKGKLAPSRKQAVRHNSSSEIDVETRKRLLARELTTPLPAEGEGINGHPICPDETDLLGFVTTGSFNLRDGQAEAIASLSAKRALEYLVGDKNKADPAARLCVVRNAGQSIGWLARWELV